MPIYNKNKASINEKENEKISSHKDTPICIAKMINIFWVGFQLINNTESQKLNIYKLKINT